MTYSSFSLQIDNDGIATYTWDMADKTMNVIDLAVIEDLEALAKEIAENDGIKGVIITSKKDSFCAGADLTMLEGLLGEFRKMSAKGKTEKAVTALWQNAGRLTWALRAIETCGKPVVAAINGTALGGGLEVALACHARVVADNDKIRLGLPEVKVGLLPGAGGTQRLPRLMPNLQKAMELVLQGKEIKPKEAKSFGIVHDVVAPRDLLRTAKAMLMEGKVPSKAPWDEKGYKIPSGRVYSPAGFNLWPPAGAIYRRETHDNYPGARYILRSMYEGLMVDIDLGLKVESRYFAKALQAPEAAAMIRSLFVSMQELNKGARRPDVKPGRLRKVGILGAGFMGAGIAYVSARAGLSVVLIDQTQEAADKGKAHSDELITKAISRGKAAKEDKEALLSKIHATADYAELKGCDLVIEAVFENREVKAEVTQKAQEHLGPSAVFASNTSTLPITSLAEAYKIPARFIGIHFFSPVDKMMLVEIIVGKRTGDPALAKALDFVKKIKKTPIVVNDTRGFFANRCVGNYVREGHLLLKEGVPPAMIENLAKQAGMPVGPLSLNDEVALDLAWKIVQATKADLGEKAVDPRQENLLEKMVVQEKRLGRKNGKGFYDYKGREKSLWPGLSDLADAELDPETIDRQEIIDRLLVVQAVEAARCFQEKVVTDVREADVGSILGFGFAPWSGGTLSYIDMMGADKFVKLCNKLAKKHGNRFKPNKLLKDMAKNGESFYGKFPPAKADKEDEASAA